ncbi:MAG: superoxide dismutase, partial [Brevundimonas sp.]
MPQSTPPAGPFTLPPLPYAANALEPSIDTRTMEIHHGRHHQAFVNNLNTAAASDPSLNQPVEALLARASSLPVSVRNNAG